MNRTIKLFSMTLILSLTSTMLSADGKASLVLHNGQILTVEESLGRVEAVAIEGHEVLAVGSDEEIEWKRSSNGLNIQLPKTLPGKIVNGFRIRSR